MTSALVGRVVAAVGIVCGLVAIGLVLVSGAGGALHYADHGFDIAFVVGLLAYASYLPAEVGQDTAGGLAGTAVFGFFAFVPAALAFDQLGSLGSAGWLGLCTVLIPLGAAIVRVAEREEDASSAPRAPRDLRGPAMLPAIALIAVGIWLPIESGGPSYWDASVSGHALGILMALAVVALLVAIAMPAPAACGCARLSRGRDVRPRRSRVRARGVQQPERAGVRRLARGGGRDRDVRCGHRRSARAAGAPPAGAVRRDLIRTTASLPCRRRSWSAARSGSGRS